MKSISEDKTNSRLLKAVAGVTISPQEAKSIVAKLWAEEKRRFPNKSDDELRLGVAKSVVKRYARLSATSGGVTALAGIVPGIGTLITFVGGGLTDATICMKLQVDMTMCLAETFGWDISSKRARKLSFLIAGSATLERFGVKKGGRLASTAGINVVNRYLQGAALSTLTAIFKKIGLNFTRKALEKSIPFGIGIAVGSTTNYALTNYVGNTAIKWFQESKESAQTADPD